MTEHTPGPWRVERSPNRRILCVFGGESFATWICGELQADNETRIDTGECLANAHLVAAAPEMLAALRFILEHIADKERGPRDLYPAFGLNSSRAVEMTRDAIAKAEGRAVRELTGHE